MADAPEPVLVYDRVSANRSATRRLLALFTLLVLPFVGGLIPLLAPVIYFGVLVPAVGRSAVERMHASTEGTALMLAATGMLTVFVVLVVGLAVASLELRQSTRLVLRLTRARPVGREDEPTLARAVENLSLAAGLPTPKAYVIESQTPNAFAVGLEPQHAAVVVTRGLLQLLDRRGVHGIVAHELSHIGNQDTRLNTLLAAVLAVFRLPVTLLRAWSPRINAGCLILSGLMFVLAAVSILAIVAELGVALWYFSDQIRETVASAARTDVLVVSGILLYGPFAMGSPFYVLFGAQLCARRVSGAVSRQREFLADADAVLLTRDPEGLALALVKIAAASGAGVSLPRAAAHLFLVEPVLPPSGWWDRDVASHPPIEERVAVLARMGSGISPEALREAHDAGERFRRNVPTARADEPVSPDAPPEQRRPSGAPDTSVEVGLDVTGIVSYIRVKHEPVALLERPDETAPVHDHLARETVLSLLGVEAGFLRVRTPRGTIGYIPKSTPLVWDME